MFVVTVHFEIHPGHEAAFRAAVIEQARLSRGEPGCRQFDVSADPRRPGAVFLYERYEDEAAFVAHQATPHFARFGAAIAPWVTSKHVSTWERVDA
jgi:quinol monooxygenase YgiN